MKLWMFLIAQACVGWCNEMDGCGDKNTGLTSIKAYMGENIYWGDDGGTNDGVKVQLSDGCEDHNNGRCTTGMLHDGTNNWSNGDEETYTAAIHDFGDCAGILGDRTYVKFKMIVDGSDALCLNKIEFVINGETYIWRGKQGEECWENNGGKTLPAVSTSALFFSGVSTKTIYGLDCSVTGCGMNKGSSYFWCYYAHTNWDYCSMDASHTRYNATCQETCSNQGGTDYFWCNKVGGGWDYCSPVQSQLY